MKREEAELRMEIDAIIRDEIQENINDYVEQKEETEKTGVGFVNKEEEDKLEVNISKREIDKIIKEYKKIKKFKKSNLGQVKKLGLVDKHGRPLNES
tara:strand:+ start:86 stop:376 length:291 start_codon:yes stop_codon:yes gene_type:complete